MTADGARTGLLRTSARPGATAGGPTWDDDAPGRHGVALQRTS